MTHFRADLGHTNSTTGALEGGKIGHLLDRRDERIQPLHLSFCADRVTHQTVNRGGGVNTTETCGIARCHTLA